MAPPTLLSMAQRNLIRNLSGLQDVGDTPYEAVKPALRKIVDPQQLRNIEIASPHIADADAELWLAFIKRDVPDWKSKIVTPKNPRSWWKVYRKLYREEKAAQEEQERQLVEALKGKQKEKEDNQAHILNTFVPQKFRGQTFADGHINPRGRSYGFEKVGTVANAKKSGKNIISAIRKASTKPIPFKAPANSAQREQVQQKMWQSAIIPPGTWKRKEAPNLLMRGPPNMAQMTAKVAMDKALREDKKIKQEREKRPSNSPPPLTSANLARHESCPSKAPSVRQGPIRQAHDPEPQVAPAAPSPPRTASSAATGNPITSLGPGAGTKRRLSPEKPSPAASPAPPQKRQRPPTSIFMPKRVKR